MMYRFESETNNLTGIQSKFRTYSSEELFDGINVVDVNERNLNALTRCQMNVALAESIGGALDRHELKRRQLPADHLQSHGKISVLFLLHETAALEGG